MAKLAVLLIASGAFIAMANWGNVFWSYYTKRFHSPVPLIGAVLLGIGMFIRPATRWYCWTALLLDFGTLALLLALPKIFHEVWATSRFNLVSQYTGQSGIRTARLCLFRKGIFTFRLEINRSIGIASRGTIGEWERDGDQLRLNVGDEAAIFTDLENAAIQQTSGFPSWEKDQDTSLTDLRFVQTKGGAK